MIQYQIQPIDPLAHLFAVEITTDQALPLQQFNLPAWLPGSYMVRDFARHIIDINAEDEAGNAVELVQTDKQSWQAQNQTQQLTVRYQVYAWDLSVRGAHLDQTHGFFNGSATFLALVGQEDKPVSVQLLAPAGEQYQAWRVATAMTLDGAQTYQYGQYRANDYAELIDHPVEMGEFTLATFEAGGVPHDLVLTGQHWADTDRICADLKKICEVQIEMFGGAPYERYLFMTQVVGDGFGGLEHRASTALVCGRNDLPSVHETEQSDGYRTFLSLCSHEYFHNWNVKRIKPAEFTPYNLSEETYTTQLWAYEGITSYYDDLIVYRAGCIDTATYLDQLAHGMTRVTRAAGRFKQTLRESSFNAWTKFYKQDENAQNAIVSYYTKGAMFALLLDLTLRHETEGKHSLDCVMKRLWQDFGAKGIGTNNDSHQHIVAELLGRDVSDLFAWLDRTDDLPLAEMLATFGCDMTLRNSASNTDKGGRSKTTCDIDFGARYKSVSGGVSIINVRNGSSAQQAGLAAGDKLIAINNLQANTNIEKQLEKYGIEQTVQLHWFRRDELMQGELALKAASPDTVVIVETDSTLVKNWL
ncbi:M61 family metallopeptidase [Ferrimonas lipolytica]|uniref:M61 family metallopeptidase n=1 Tax=Ferrimonas lipolytica TaxID=2724191 RepID=A0A6H1UCP2_9GAMM|nr:PDZ domain-containing protein [Ferrimonas lipolytica]QIZ76123.1 M61 family metallopeptidase [Ferrimonas lipolytica]